MNNRLLILGSMDEFVALVKLAKQRGYYVVVCDGYEFGPAKAFADKAYNIDVRNVDEIVALCEKEKINGIMGSFSDILFEQITYIADKAGLKWYMKPQQLKFYREKDEAKKLMSRAGISVPKNKVLDLDFSDADLEGLQFPVVIKPLNGCGSKGIYVVHSIEEIRQKFADVIARGSREKIIAEEYVCGKEYNLISWLIDGKVHVISVANREKNPQEGDSVPLLNRIVYPARELDEILPAATDVLQRFADATGQKSGPMCMQFFYHNSQVIVCEIAGRIFGYEHELVEMSGDYSIEKLLLDYVYDEKAVEESLIGHSPYFTKYCAGIYFVGRQGKIIADQSIAQELMKESHVVDGICYYSNGDMVDNYGPKPYLARYYIQADSREELDCVTEYFYEKMSVLADDGTEVCEKFILEK